MTNHSDSKNASKPNAKTVQLDFLPREAAYPAELVGRKEPVVQLGAATWVRRSSIVNPPDAKMNRYSPEEWRDQLHSFRTLGIKSAVHVRPVEGGFWLEDGRHRVLGATELGWDYVKADVNKGTAATSAVWRFEANTRRKADRPLDQALTWQEEMRDGGLTQAQISAVHKVSQATVSRRLRLVHANFPRDLAVRVGVDLDEKILEPLFCVLDDAELMKASSAAILKALAKEELRSQEQLAGVACLAWLDEKAPLAVEEYALPSEVRADKDWKAARAGFKPFTVKVERYGRIEEHVFLRDGKAAKAKAQEISDRLEAEREAEEKRLAAKAAKEGKKVKDGKVVEAPKKRTVAERIPEWTTKVQLDLMARFVPAQVGFPDDFVGECLARFVEWTPRLMSNQDKEAACRALGIQGGEGGSYGMGFSREDFLARWKKDRPRALQMAAVALFYQARDGSKQLKDGTSGYGKPEATEQEPRLPKWLTGHTYEQATELAQQAIRDRDAGFKAVVDGALCDHCDEPAMLRKGGTNVCRSEVFKDITATKLAARRLARTQAAKAAAQAKPEATMKPAKNGAAKEPKNGAKAKPKSKPAAAA